jgi:benzodiazapine receptor
MKYSKSTWISLLGFMLLCGTAQWVSAKFTLPSVREWYPSLLKPSWTAPDWVFAPVWTLLYSMMAVAAWQVWLKRREEISEGFPLLPFLLQLVLNVFWSALFFGMRRPAWAFYEIGLLWMVVVFTIVSFKRISVLAALLMLPYLAWLTYAGCLNFAIWRMN